MSEVLVERVGLTLVVTINRKETRNALTRAVLSGVREAFDAASNDSTVRCVILTGAGGHFCAGADLRKNIADDPELFDHLEQYMDDFHAVIRAIVRCNRPSIAMIDGCAVGFGADMALACDLRVVTPGAYIQEKFVHIGLMPDGGGTFWLPRLIGTARAMQAMLFGDKMEGAKLLELGIAMELAAPEALRDTTLALARRLEDGPPLAFSAIRHAVYASLGSIEDALRREREAQLKLLRSSDAIEGIMAWTQKRPPGFTGT